MPKMKTRKSAARRYKVTGSGKIVRRHSGINHKLQKKRRSSVRALGNNVEVSESDLNKVTRQLPYKKYLR